MQDPVEDWGGLFKRLLQKSEQSVLGNVGLVAQPLTLSSRAPWQGVITAHRRYRFAVLSRLKNKSPLPILIIAAATGMGDASRCQLFEGAMCCSEREVPSIWAVLSAFPTSCFLLSQCLHHVLEEDQVLLLPPRGDPHHLPGADDSGDCGASRPPLSHQREQRQVEIFQSCHRTLLKCVSSAVI